MSSDKIDPGDELRIINNMLARTRRRTAESGDFLIAWGVIILLAIGIMWGLMHLEYYEYIWLDWLAAMALGAGYSVWKGRKMERKTRVRTYVDTALTGTWIALGIGFFLVNLVGPFIYSSFESLSLVNAVLAGCGLFITGILLDVKRLIWFAGLWWVGGVAMAFWESPHVLGLFMLLIVLGYLWPGIYLNRFIKRGEDPDVAG